MKFFTRAWATGELTHEEYEATASRYREYVERLGLPEDIWILEETNLHDGILQSLGLTASDLFLQFITGDLHRGYFDTKVTYLTEGLAESTVETLRSFVSDPDEEVIYAEVDREGAGFVHRLLFSTYVSVDVAFTSVVVKSSPRDSRVVPVG